MTTVINNWTHSGSLWFFPPNSPNQNSQNQEPKMILTNSGLYLNGDFTLKNGSQWNKKILVSDKSGNAIWSDADCGGGFALQGFDENGWKICTELPFGVYSYPNFVRDTLQKNSEINISFHMNSAIANVLFSTDESTYSGGAWLIVDKYWNTWVFTNKDDPKSDYCWIVSPGWFVDNVVFADNVSISGRYWFCRGQFVSRGKSMLTDYAEKWWYTIDHCQFASGCSNEVFGDTYPDKQLPNNKIRRWHKSYIGCDVRSNTYAKDSPRTINPETGNLIKKWEKCSY